MGVRDAAARPARRAMSPVRRALRAYGSPPLRAMLRRVAARPLCQRFSRCHSARSIDINRRCGGVVATVAHTITSQCYAVAVTAAQRAHVQCMILKKIYAAL